MKSGDVPSTISRRVRARGIRGLIVAAGLALAAVVSGPAQSDDVLAPYQAKFQAALQPAVWNGPTEKTTPPKDKYVVVVSCTWALIGCKVGALAVEDAAHKIGWRVKTVVVNDPTGNDEAMLTAINEGADAIVIQGLDQALFTGGLAKAREKKIPVVSLFQYNQPGPFGVDTDVHPDGDHIGSMLADAALVQNSGKVRALFLNDAEFHLPITVLDSVKKELDSCTGCQISYADPVNFTANTIGTTLPDRVVAAVRRDPTINSIFIGFDPPTTFIVPALDAAGFRGKVTMYSQLGNAAPLSYVRDNNILVGNVGSSEGHGGWGCIDELIRLMNGQPVVDEGVPVQLFSSSAVDKLPAPGEVYTAADTGFEQKYAALWGVQ